MLALGIDGGQTSTRAAAADLAKLRPERGTTSPLGGALVPALELAGPLLPAQIEHLEDTLGYAEA